MELRHLRYFVTVAEERNVSRAAARLYVSQPAVSKQLKDLATELGVELFTRTPAGIRLTNAGETFLVHAREVLRRAAQAAQAMAAFRGNHGGQESLAIGYLPTAMPSFLAAGLNQFAAAHPRVSVELRELSPGQQVEELSAGRLDLAFVGNACPELHDRFEVRTVRRVPLAVAVNQSSGTARRRGGVDLAGLAGENFLGFDEKKFPGRNTLICDLCRAAGFTPALETRADSLTSLLALVGAGRGIALIPEDAASLPHPQVAFVGLKSPRASVDWSVVLRKDGANRLAGEFVSLLTKAE